MPRALLPLRPQLRQPPLVQVPPQLALALLQPLLPTTRTRQKLRTPLRPRLQPSPLRLRRPLRRQLRLHQLHQQLKPRRLNSLHRRLSPHKMVARSS